MEQREEAKEQARQALLAGQGERAVSQAGLAVQLDVNDVGALTLLGEAQLLMGLPEFALPPLRRALALDPGAVPACQALAAALSALERDEEAAAIWERAAVAMAVAAGRWAPSGRFTAVARELGDRLAAAGQEEAARRFRAAALMARAG